MEQPHPHRPLWVTASVRREHRAAVPAAVGATSVLCSSARLLPSCHAQFFSRMAPLVHVLVCLQIVIIYLSEQLEAGREVETYN